MVGVLWTLKHKPNAALSTDHLFMVKLLKPETMEELKESIAKY